MSNPTLAPGQRLGAPPPAVTGSAAADLRTAPEVRARLFFSRNGDFQGTSSSII